MVRPRWIELPRRHVAEFTDQFFRVRPGLALTAAVIIEADALQIAHDSPWKLMAFTASSATSSITLMWSPHRGLCPSALCVAAGSSPQFRGFRL
jgi:hypothetical protein